MQRIRDGRVNWLLLALVCKLLDGLLGFSPNKSNRIWSSLIKYNVSLFVARAKVLVS